jgi:hypothetical protein
MMNKKLILVELNEINFDIVKKYVESGIKLPGFEKVINDGFKETSSESEYDKLEPWIQWPSVHTGKRFEEHKVFRLGDFINSSDDQFFEILEKNGYKVGAISPMNASNKLSNPAYFIPDPWTQTPSDKSFISRALSSAISQAVNDNSKSKLTLTTIIKLLISIVSLIKPSRIITLFMYAISSIKQSWKKALFLDLLLYEFHKTLMKRKKPDFAVIFLNAGAHIQHHYFYNSPFVTNKNLKNPNWYLKPDQDPFLDMLYAYDHILQDIFFNNDKNTEVIIATGLSQKPFNELKFYYRLSDHKTFLNELKIPFKEVFPRMTRDFLITFDSDKDAKFSQEILENIYLDDGIQLFGEIDNRGKDLFVVLTYPNEIKPETKINILDKKICLNDLVTFVAIKNGEHQSKGYAYFSKDISKFSLDDGDHVSSIFRSVTDYFGIQN